MERPVDGKLISARRFPPPLPLRQPDPSLRKMPIKHDRVPNPLLLQKGKTDTIGQAEIPRPRLPPAGHPHFVKLVGHQFDLDGAQDLVQPMIAGVPSQPGLHQGRRLLHHVVGGY